MRKPILHIITVIIILIIGFYTLDNYIQDKEQSGSILDYKNAEYVIDGRNIKLESGVSEIQSATSSESKIVTKYFGNEIKKDLDGDEREDVLFLLTQQTGGSGTFYYVVAALNTAKGYLGSEGLLLGDRIAPQTTESGSGKIVIVNYADRAQAEPFTSQPSIGKSIWLLLDPKTMQFGEVQQNFEGEADPSRMKLNMKTWNWVSALYNDGREIKPKKTGSFTIGFPTDSKFSATTDCNNMSGNYKASGATISFSQTISTKMYCQGSQESDFAALLENANAYHFTSRGELIFDLKFDSGTVTFK